MATFKVGMRVRVIAASQLLFRDQIESGQEGTILEVCVPADLDALYPNEIHHRVEVDGYPGPRGRGWKIEERILVPLTDPRESEWADAKLEQLKRLVREPPPPHPAEVA